MPTCVARGQAAHKKSASFDALFLDAGLAQESSASTVLDADGTLALGKFPSVEDSRSVTRGEVLALKLALTPSPDARARISGPDAKP